MIFEDEGKKGYKLAKELDDKVELLLERLEVLESKNSNSSDTSLGENEVKIERYDYDGFTSNSIAEKYSLLGAISFPPNEYIMVCLFSDVTTSAKMSVTSTLYVNSARNGYESKSIKGSNSLRTAGYFTNSTGTSNIGVYTYTGTADQAVFHKMTLLIVGREFSFVKN